MKCVYCREDKATDSFNAEHVIPPTFGGAAKDLGDFVCAECNAEFNKQFEQDFLRGPGFESFNRAMRGLKGRNKYPVWADGSYKNFRIFEEVVLRFPRVGVIVFKDKVYTPHQLIVQTDKEEYLYSYRLPEDQFGSNFKMFNGLLAKITTTHNPVAIFFWAQDTELTVAESKQIGMDFYYWLGQKGIMAGSYECGTYVSGSIELRTDIEARNRMFCKMCLNFLFWLMDNREMCLRDNFDSLREYVRFGKKPKEFVRVWNSSYNPFLAHLEHNKADISVGVLTYKWRLFGTIYLPISGTYLIDIGDARGVVTHRDRNGIAGVDDEVICFMFARNAEDLWSFPVRQRCKNLGQLIFENEEFLKCFPEYIQS